MKHEESHIQMVVVHWARMKHPNLLLTTSPAAMKTTMAQGVRLKRMGYLKGTPDLMVFKAKKGYYGLLIELKTGTGKLSEYQKRFIELANSEGYKAIVCYGADEAIATIEEYLK